MWFVSLLTSRFQFSPCHFHPFQFFCDKKVTCFFAWLGLGYVRVATQNKTQNSRTFNFPWFSRTFFGGGRFHILADFGPGEGEIKCPKILSSWLPRHFSLFKDIQGQLLKTLVFKDILRTLSNSRTFKNGWPACKSNQPFSYEISLNGWVSNYSKVQGLLPTFGFCCLVVGRTQWTFWLVN